jgi:xylose isomerase
MKKKFSVFLSNVGACSDRYCAQYAPPFSVRELFQRAAAIPGLSGVDLVGTWNISPATANEVAHYLRDTGLTLVSIAPDLFASPQWGKGSLSSVDPKIRQAALDGIRQTMDLTAQLGCDLLTIWPGQDGYDYSFQADYITEHGWFAEGIAKVCAHNPRMRVAIEYKLKEPRTHSYISSAATALLLIQEVGAANLGVALDYGHALLGYENGAESVALLKRHGDRLFHVHINDNYRLWDDDLIVGSVHTIEFLEFFHWLARTGYDGWLTIDQFPYREDGRAAVAESAAWMSGLIDMAGRMDRQALDAALQNKDAIAASRLLRRTILGQ